MEEVPLEATTIMITSAENSKIGKLIARTARPFVDALSPVD
jgi:hypothetical protein